MCVVQYVPVQRLSVYCEQFCALKYVLYGICALFAFFCVLCTKLRVFWSLCCVELSGSCGVVYFGSAELRWWLCCVSGARASFVTLKVKCVFSLFAFLGGYERWVSVGICT
ncbi:Zinc Finger Fyve Domain-Containing Protein 26, partial [Manis pentadactyla]